MMFGVSFDQAITWMIAEYGSNDFLVGTSLPFVFTAIAYGLARFVRRIYQYILRNFTVSIRINSTNTYFRETNKYVFENYVWGLFKRNYTLTYSRDDQNMISTSGYGNSFGFVLKNPTIITLSSEESDSYEFKEFLTIKILCFRPVKTSQKVLAEIQEYIKSIKTDEKIAIYKTLSRGDTDLVTRKPKRSMSSIFMDEDVKSNLLNSLIKFKNSEQEYADKGIPWNMGIILHGPPGTGKTSLIHALASTLDRDIHYHSVGSLINVNLDSENSILVLEDIDRANFSLVPTKSGENNASDVKIECESDTLNFLDGFLTPHGMIVIATTNHIEDIDPALIRPGRFDVVQEIPEMEKDQYLKMCKFHDIEPVLPFEKMSGAKAMALIKSHQVKKGS